MTPPSVHPRPQRLTPTRPAVLALGSNLGDRASTLSAAFGEIDSVPGIHVGQVSPLYETPALTLAGVDYAAPSYLNAVVLIRTSLAPHELLDAVHKIEAAHGRVRAERWGSRTLDIDVIDFDGISVDDETMTLPHPRAWERGFVLAPWFAVDPDAVIVGRGRVSELLRATSDTVTMYSERRR